MKQILIADDDPAIRAIFESFFLDRGYGVEVFQEGTSVMARLSSSRPEMLLVNVRLPEVSGMEILQESLELYPDLPVIVISCYGDEPLARQALRMGAYDFFLKPLDLATVELRLSAKLGLLKLAGEAGG